MGFFKGIFNSPVALGNALHVCDAAVHDHGDYDVLEGGARRHGGRVEAVVKAVVRAALVTFPVHHQR